METGVVTGGSRGIGASIARILLDHGWRVLTIARGPGEEIPSGGSIEFIRADLSTEDGIREAANRVSASTESVDLVVNNAGAFLEDERFDRVTYRDMQYSFQLNLMAPLFFTRSLAPLLNKSSHPSVVNIGSVYGSIADTEAVAYCLAKSGVPLLTAMLAKALAPAIRVNCILPGHVNTDMTRRAPSEFLSAVVEKTPLRRIAEPQEIASLVLFLASPGASFVTGACLRADGGFAV